MTERMALAPAAPVVGLRSLQAAAVPALIVAAATAIWLATFIGYTASDDASYLVSARGWLHNFPYVGIWWWDMRHTITLPIAMTIGLFGENEITMTLPDLGYFIGIVLMAFYLARRVAGPIAGAIAAGLLLTIPVVAVAASVANVDLPEAFFVLLSVTLFLSAQRRVAGRTVRLLGAGGAAALAVLSRETALALLFVYLIAFLGGYGITRRQYWIMAAGFIAVAALDPLYFAIAAGDPLHRLKIALAGLGNNDRDNTVAFGIDSAGALRIHPLIDPLLLLFTRPDFGILFYLFVPASLWAVSRRQEASPPIVTARLLALLAVVSLVFNAIVLRHNQILVRYDTLAVTVAAITVAIWLAQRGLRQWPRATMAIIAVAIVTNLLGACLINRDPRRSERELIVYLASHQDVTVVTDPETAYRAGLLLRWADDLDRVKGQPPRPGDIYFYAPNNATKASPKLAAANLPLYRPQPDWTVEWRDQPERPMIGTLIERLGLKGILPARLYAALDRPGVSVAVYKIGADTK